MATFNNLPVEIILMLTQHLKNEELRRLRLVSREVSTTIFDCFAKRHFRKKGFFITTESLSTLDKISSHVDFAPYVEHLWFNPDCYTFVDETRVIGHGGRSEVGDVQQETQLQAFWSCVTDHESLFGGSRLSVWLSTCFSRLKSLRVIGMRRGKKHRPWSYSILRKRIGLDPRILGQNIAGAALEATALFVALLSALHSAKVKLHRLYTDTIEIDDVRSDQFDIRGCLGAMGHVKCLEVNLKKCPLSCAEVGSLEYVSLIGKQVLPLLASMPAIIDISLTIFAVSSQNHIIAPVSNMPESWTSTYPYVLMQRMSQETRFCNLRRVKIEKLTTSALHLQTWLGVSFDQLKSLKLKDINFVSDHGQVNTPWTSFFTFLGTCKKLEYLFLSYLRQDGRHVKFVEEIPTNLSSQMIQKTYNAAWIHHDQFTIVVDGLDRMRIAIELLISKHWCSRGHFTSMEIDDIWYTDTSDEAAYTEDEE